MITTKMGRKIMVNHSIKADDCEDCKREKAENDKLIAIYEKLQEVDQRTANMKSSIASHKDNA